MTRSHTRTAFWKYLQLNYGNQRTCAQKAFNLEDVNSNAIRSIRSRPAYAFLGQKEKVYQSLEEFGKLDFYPLWCLTLIKNDPLFESIRSEERFQNLIRQMEIKHNVGHERVRKWLEENNML